MQPKSHGDHLTVQAALVEREARLGISRKFSTKSMSADGVRAKPASREPATGFGVMFTDLRAAEHQLPATPEIIVGLSALADAMLDQGEESDASPIPTVYTYFGQFVDHDITLQGTATDQALLDLPHEPAPAPFKDLFGGHKIANARTGRLDLDSVYEPQRFGGAPPPRNGAKMRIDAVEVLPDADSGKLPPGKTLTENDLPREPSGVAMTGDPRNDENLVVAQFHVAMLRAHNACVASGLSFDAARARMRRIFQHVVLEDFLPTVCGKEIVQDVKTRGRQFWNPKGAGIADLPIEFSAAAYRFGHSMIRRSYDFNLNFGKPGAVFRDHATLDHLFRFTQLSGGRQRPVPENWVIEWERFFEESARPIDATLTSGLGKLPPEGAPDVMRHLAERNLFRGFLFGLPTGQAVATAMGVAPLSAAQLRKALPSELAIKQAGFDKASPLWFYVLAEAGVHGGRLGPVGGRIVVETLHALIEASEDSILARAPEAEERLDLRGLLRLSGNLT